MNENITMEDKLEIEDEISNISRTIKQLKNYQKEYYLNNSKYIFDYFENKNNISKGENETNFR